MNVRIVVLAVVGWSCLGLAAAGAADSGEAKDPYAVWAQGRPAEAVPALVAMAGTRWDGWYDAGLAAAAAEDRGRAVACLARAMTIAPAEPEPRQALRALGIEVPPSWSERAGPVALPGYGWFGVVLIAVAGGALGWAGCGTRGRRRAAIVGVVALVLVAPGALAQLADSRHAWAGTVRATQLLDSAGNPQQALPAGTLVDILPREAWSGRVVAQTVTGVQGFVPQRDLTPE